MLRLFWQSSTPLPDKTYRQLTLALLNPVLVFFHYRDIRKVTTFKNRYLHFELLHFQYYAL